MDLMQILIIILSAAFGAATTAIVIRISSRTKEDFDKLLKVWTEDNSRLRISELSARSRVDELEAVVNNLRNKIILLESSHMDLPLPMWLKDTNGTMLAVNKEYEKQFLFPIGLTASDYIGRKDEDIWPHEISEEYRRNDLLVMRTRQTMRKKEKIKVNGHAQEIEMIKYPRYAGRVLIGIGGIAIT